MVDPTAHHNLVDEMSPKRRDELRPVVSQVRLDDKIRICVSFSGLNIINLVE